MSEVRGAVDRLLGHTLLLCYSLTLPDIMNKQPLNGQNGPVQSLTGHE